MAVVLGVFIILKAAPGYGTLALVVFVFNPGILIARLFIHPAPPRTPGIDYIVDGISLIFYTALLYLIFWLYDSARRK